MSDFIITFLVTGLAVFAGLAVIAYLVVRFVFVRMAERISARIAVQIENTAGYAVDGVSRSIGSQVRVPQALLDRLDRTARLMDRAIPLPLFGGVGLDALLGLIPYVGDTASALVTGSLILQSLQYGLPKELVAKMVANMFVDVLFGAIPILGDIFDITFKANTRNMALLRSHLAASADRQ
jgi:hypothetical protein